MPGPKCLVLAAGALAAALVAQLSWSPPAQAREYPWCARYDWTTYNCGFVSFRQCLATIQGMGGICEPNPRYVGPAAAPRRKPRRAY